MDLKEIQNLIKFVAKSGATEVKLEVDNFKITIKTTPEASQSDTIHVPVSVAGGVVQQVPSQQPIASIIVPTEAEETTKYVTIKSPIIGTLYRKPSPDKAPFVEVGNTIAKGDVLCVIEAMKLFNEIESEISGKIVKILADDASPVEFDQPLFLVDPS